MRLLSYKYCDQLEKGWDFSQISLKDINLLVGISGSGKTRILNTIFNLSQFLIGKQKKSGRWEVEVDIEGTSYRLEVFSLDLGENNVTIEREVIEKRVGESWVPIVDRTSSDFVFCNNKLPKLSKDESAISLMKDEPEITVIHKAFEKIFRSDFSTGKLKDAVSTFLVDVNKKNQIASRKDLLEIFKLDGLSDRLDILKKAFPAIYDEILEHIFQIFPFIQEIDIVKKDTPFGKLPVFCIKEKGVQGWIDLRELSSGMQKVVLLITDMFSLPGGSIYLLDEYENSLGINAIDVLPTLMIESKRDNQFIITSHHPYIINNLPISNWYICYRRGQRVNIKYGDEIVERYGKSKQKAFINLINDPLFIGVE